MRWRCLTACCAAVALAGLAGCGPRPPRPDRQLLFIGLTRHWSTLDPDGSAALVQQCGAHGRSYELLEIEPASLGRQGMEQYLAGQIEKLRPHVAADRRHGLLSKVYFWNTNARPQDCLTVAQFEQLIDLFGRRIGWRGVLCLFMNENDDNTPADVRHAVTVYGLSRLQPGYRISCEGQPAADFTEYHPQHLDAIPGPRAWSTIIASDCGTLLRELYAGAPGSPACRPKLDAWQTFVASAWKQGQSVDCYTFDTEWRPDWVRACCAAAVLPSR